MDEYRYAYSYKQYRVLIMLTFIYINCRKIGQHTRDIRNIQIVSLEGRGYGVDDNDYREDIKGAFHQDRRAESVESLRLYATSIVHARAELDQVRETGSQSSPKDAARSPTRHTHCSKTYPSDLEYTYAAAENKSELLNSENETQGATLGRSMSYEPNTGYIIMKQIGFRKGPTTDDYVKMKSLADGDYLNSDKEIRNFREKIREKSPAQ